MLASIKFLFSYNDWANARTFQSLESLNDEQWTRNVGGSFATIRDTAAHIVSTEWIWLQRWLGVSPTAPPEWAAAPAFAPLKDRLEDITRDRATYIASLAESDLSRDLSFRRLNGEANALPLAHLLQHVANHSTYHRGQIATLLRQVGATPIATDLLFFRPQS